MRVWATMVMAVALIAAACGGSSGPSASERTASAGGTATVVATSDDANALTAIALQPSDVPAGLPHTESFGNEYQGQVISYTTTYGDDAFSISSSIGQAAPGQSIDQAVLRLRQLQTSLFRLERNYALDGADQAFAYAHPQALGVATLVLKDGYYVSVVVQTRDKARTAEAQDQASLDRYTKAVFDRLKAYLADPTSVTPVPGTPRFGATPAAD